jgi:hypothetical protein
MRHFDQNPYDHFCTKNKLHRSVSMLYGIVDGITSDGEVNDQELQLLVNWMELHAPMQESHPFNEFFPLLGEVLSDGVLDANEREDILWLSNKILQGELESAAKTDMQILHGMLQGIIADGKVLKSELLHLQDWISNRSHLKGIWPYDEIDSLICSVLRDGVIDEIEHQQLIVFLSDFCELNPTESAGEVRHAMSGICATCPEIDFPGRRFCITGSITGYSQHEVECLVKIAGGIPWPRVTAALDYLIVGSQGNPCWAFACYGRKVEHAMQLRRDGSRLLIVHESDFFDAIRELGVIEN